MLQKIQIGSSWKENKLMFGLFKVKKEIPNI